MTRRKQLRRGNIVVLTAVLLVVIIACIAFAVDIGYICLVRTQSQNAADAAAMAGTGRLPAGAAEVRLAARNFAQANRADGSAVVLPDAKIVLGTWDFKSATFAPLKGAGESKANAVKVTCLAWAARAMPWDFSSAASWARKLPTSQRRPRPAESHRAAG